MVTLTFKVSDEEARLIRARARRQRISVSEYLRRQASVSTPATAEPKLVRCSHTGALIFAAPKNAPRLTTEMVRDLLVDFP